MKNVVRLAIVTIASSLAGATASFAAPTAPVTPPRPSAAVTPPKPSAPVTPPKPATPPASAAVRTIKVPDFVKLNQFYPTGEAEDVKARLGGAINAAWITNTCTIRLSRALNYSGVTVPWNFPVLASNGKQAAAVTVLGADKKRHMIRVREMWQWVKKIFGKSVSARYETGELPGPPAAIMGKQGILYVKVDVWSDATGHFGVWNGSNWLSTGSHDQMGYFKLSSGYEFWESGK